MVREAETLKVPIAPVGRWLTCPNRLSSFNSDRYLVLSGTCTCQPHLLTSHRPDGKCLVDMSISILIFDDGCCLDLPVSSTCPLRLKNPKFPIAPMGIPDDMPKSTLIFQFGSLFGSIRDLYVPATPANFPSPRWDFHMFCGYARRAAVSLFGVAR